MADLEHLVDLWWLAIQDLTSVAAEVPDDAWHAPTDLDGWDVHDQLAHVAHLETILAGGADETVDVGAPEHVKSMMGTYTEQGVVARKGRTPAELIAEIAAATARRKAELDSTTLDAAAPAPGAFGFLGWSTEKLLKNRPLDVWMHAQDIRRAIGRPGDLDSAPAQHVADYLLESVGFVVGKKVGAPVGTSVTVDVAGSAPVTVAVGDDGRARPTESSRPDLTRPTVTLTMDREAWIVLAGGRRSPDAVDVTIEGDADLGAAILANLAVTP